MAIVPDTRTVSQLPLFAGLPPDQLARLTPLPGGAWVTIFALVALAALALSARWLVR